MNEEEEQAAELLWRYIEERKRDGSPEPFHFVARSPVDPAEAALLIPVADAAHAAHLPPPDGTPAPGQDAARQRLSEAISAGAQPAPAPVRTLWRRETWPLVALLLLGTAILAGQTFLSGGANLRQFAASLIPSRPAPPPEMMPVTRVGCGCHGSDVAPAGSPPPFAPFSFMPKGKR